MKRKVALLSLALALFGVLGVAACKQQAADEEGQWIRLPGGRMVHGTPGKPETIERLIYKIDHFRYFTMMVSEDFTTCGSGTVWYHDKKRGIHSEVGSTEVNDLKIFSLDPDKNLAIPVPSGDLQNNSELLFSTDYGKTWRSMGFVSPRAGMIVKDDILVFLDGSAYLDEPVEIDGAQVWNFARLVTEANSSRASPLWPDKYDYRHEDEYNTSEKKIWSLRRSASGKNIPDVKIDIATYPNVTPPSGWRHLRCDPMPNTPTKP